MRLERKKVLVLLALLGLIAGACNAAPASTTSALPAVQASPTTFVSPIATSTVVPSATLAIIPSATTAETPAPTDTPDPYYLYTIDYLTGRSYGEGEIFVEETLAENSYFTRYLIRFSSDGLKIYGFLNVPVGDGPYPVIIALHGYIDPAIYQTLDYTTGYADALARAGYVVFHPNLRGYQPSEDGPNLFRTGMAIDVLNLIALIEKFDGTPGLLKKVDSSRIGLWGHSMGGGISTRVMSISPAVDAVVLYGAMSGDEQRNYEAIARWSGNTRGLEELEVPQNELLRISPLYYFERIQAVVSIHHGAGDELVPPDWSDETCSRLMALGKTVECFNYAGQPHTFYGEGEQLFIQRSIEFYDRILKAP